MLGDLPVETVEYRLSKEEQACPKCSEQLHEMSKENGVHYEPQILRSHPVISTRATIQTLPNLT